MGLKRIVFLLFFLLTLISSALHAEVLKTINISMPSNYGTFFGEIHYSEKDLALALRVERIIKEDLIKVINYFEYVPHDVVHFNIDPYMRLTNGNARTFPTNIINLYNFPANNQEHLIVMENWLQGLVLHEFIHITHLDQTRDYLHIGREIFGTIAKIPAGIVPRWFSEGIAVWGESYLINGGRLNNPFFNKELFIQFKKQDFCKTIDCLDNPGFYPNGQLAYWAGAHFIEYLEKRRPKTIKCLVEMNSASLPFFLNDAFEACAGEKSQDLYKKFREDYEAQESTIGFISSEKKEWGEKITNAFGSDDYQKGMVLDSDRLFKVEHERFSEALVSYDLKDQVNFKGQYDAPISDVSSMVEINNEKMLLVSFNEDSNFRIQNKVWKLINPDTLLVERVLEFPHDPSYVMPFGEENYTTFSYWENKWQAERNGSLLRIFPSEYNIVLVKKLGDQLLLKINDANGISSLILTDEKLQKLMVIYKSEKAYDLPLITEKNLVIRENGELKLLELSKLDKDNDKNKNDKNKEVILSSLPKNLFDGITFAAFNNERILLLDHSLKTQQLMINANTNESENFIEDNLNKEKSSPMPVEVTEYNFLPSPASSFASEKSEPYPRADHLIPHYWFLAFGSSDNLGSLGALTTFVDPMDVHTLNATVLVYPSESKLGGNLDYNQKLVKVSDLWSLTGHANQDYSKTDFNSSLILSRDLKLQTNYKFLLKKWTYTPGVFAGSSTTNDFLSDRTVKNIGMNHSLVYQALSYDDFFQNFTGVARLQMNKANRGGAYLFTQLQTEGDFRFTHTLMGSINASYSKLFKSDFYRGVIYGGGVSNYTKARIHEFYGIPYSNAYGNEIFTARFSLDYNFWDIYRGKDLLPFFFKEAHLLLGHESMYANRIFLDGGILVNKMINVLFIGPRLKMNLFYYVPTNIDLILSRIAHPDGRSINQVAFTISTDLF